MNWCFEVEENGYGYFLEHSQFTVVYVNFFCKMANQNSLLLI
jgi:hypothetical protein